MKTMQIPKKSGGFRTVYVPSNAEKMALREELEFLHELQDLHCNPKIVHGFSKRHNIVTNAMQHIGRQYTTCFDIKDFFDSVTIWQVGRILCPSQLTSTEEIKDWSENFTNKFNLMFIDGVARQGLPTSPLLANIAASKLDKALEGLTRSGDIVYTRYADDLTFSYNEITFGELLLNLVPKIVKDEGFEINEKKTRTMSAKKGRRIITGIAVGDKDIHVPRRIKRKLRAAIHNKNRKAIVGFSEYAKLKLPREICFEALEAWKNQLFDMIKFKLSARKKAVDLIR